MLKGRALLNAIRSTRKNISIVNQPGVILCHQNCKALHASSAVHFSSVTKEKFTSDGSSSNSTDDENNRNPLKRFLVDKIRLTGPMSVAEYMQICVGSPGVGYYSKSDGEILGARGDFITSPEFTQMLGELIGVWAVNEWFRMAQGAAGGPWQLVELGPGSGRLAHDILRVMRTFRLLDDGALDVRLIETSRQLIREQATVLCGDDDSFVVPETKTDDVDETCSKVSSFGPTVHWHDRLEQVPAKFSIFVAHEFFDALPVHKFKRTAQGWREVVIGLDGSRQNLEYQLASGVTAAQQLYLTPALQESTKTNDLEVSPTSTHILDILVDRINAKGGAALIVDYGAASEQERQASNGGDTLRAFKNHKLVDALLQPGRCDVTADVNFDHLIAPLRSKVSVFGPLDQKTFLENLGLHVRFDKLLKAAQSDHERDYLKKSLALLTDPQQMGTRFKAVALFPKIMEDILAKSPPSGFCPLT